MQESTKHHDNDYANKEMELPDVKEEIDVKEEEQNEMVEDTTSGKQVDTADAFVDGKQEKEAEVEVVQVDTGDTNNKKEDTDENVVEDNGGEKDIDKARENEGTQEDMKKRTRIKQMCVKRRRKIQKIKMLKRHRLRILKIV
uniref:Uncharacterized protein n=1 Tax=Ditylum brightwellii TaxID=49249 RepID=A0A7S4QKI8_9STRA